MALAFVAGRADAQPPPPSAPEVIVPPRPVTPLHAGYPEGASGDAKVVLVVIVNADGTVRSAKPSPGAPEPFASAAVAASSGWRFEPATRDGKPMAAKILAEIVFTAPAPAAPEIVAPPPNTASSTAPPPPPPPPPIDVNVQGELPAPGVATFSRAEVRLLPGAFGDPFRAVETLPGVTPLASGVPFFYVRGAPPGNVGYYLDGIRVPLLYHIGLGPSVVHPAIVDRVDLYPGGYPASFGRYAGGIVSGETRDPSGEWHGEAALRLVDTGAMLEGPLGDRGAFFVSGRVSYVAPLLAAVHAPINLGYWDYSGRATVHLTARDDLTLFAFGARDYLDGEEDHSKQKKTLFNTTFHRLDLRYDHRFGGAEDHVRTAITLGIDHTGFDPSSDEPTKKPGVYDRIIAARAEVTKRATEHVLVRAGLDVQIDAYDADDLAAAFGRGASGFTSYFESHTDVAAGARVDAVIAITPRFEITPGVRVDFFASPSGSHVDIDRFLGRVPALVTRPGETAIAVDPRLAARLAITKSLRLVQAHGLASQTPSFILPGPGFQPALSGGLQRAFQTSGGLEADLPWDVTASATIFHNTFFNMTDALGTNPVPGNGNSFPNDFTRRSLGSSTGLEVTVRRNLTRRLGGFISYTLSRSERYLDRARIPSSFDRTHVFNAALAYDFGKGYKAGSRLFFYTGAPNANDTGRLPPFFRFDWRAEKRWKIGRGWLSLVLEVQNSMLAKETLQEQCAPMGGACDRTTIGPVTIPSIGLEGGF